MLPSGRTNTTLPGPDVVRLVDDPVSGEGRHYVIERELTTMAELEAIIADYLTQAQMVG
jgi:hypothetical protein